MENANSTTRALEVNTLTYGISDENGLSFELLVDGEPLGALVGARGSEIPFRIVGDDLPTWPPRSPDVAPDVRIVAVCSCGVYGCGHTRCRVARSDGAVVFSDFDCDCTAEGRQRRFVFAPDDYDRVVSEIAALAREKQESEIAGEMTAEELLAWADRIEAAATGPEKERRGLDPDTLKNCAQRIRELAARRSSGGASRRQQ